MQRAIAESEPPPLMLGTEPPAPRRNSSGWSVTWRALLGSRLVICATGILAVLEITPPSQWRGYDPAGLTTPFSYFPNLLVAPAARWDSVWYLTIAQSGYGHHQDQARTAFFPLYPLLMHVLGWPLQSNLVAGIVISLACFAIALVLLHRLVCIELSSEVADVTVMLVAFCPMAYYFSAVYTESLFLALSVGCFLCARRGRWGRAAALGALAASARNSGVMLAVPFVLLYLYGPRGDRLAPELCWQRATPILRRLLPRYRPGWRLAWVLLIPLGLAAYVAYLQLARGEGAAPFHAGAVWYRYFAGPFGGVWDGAVAAWDGLRQVLHGPAPPIYFTQAGGDPLAVAGANLMLFAFLVLGAVALVGVLRRLPFAYGAYVLASLALPLSYPVSPQPLQSLPRYQVVLFPLFISGALFVVRRRLLTGTIATLAVLLGLFTAEFVTWRFVA